MYLEKIELNGFKSFAKRTEIRFAPEGKKNHNLTAIVGPNGSGKSNVADAIRWVLGEQSSKQLRGKKSEDVIFAGSASRGKMGMAEVSLFLNNEDKKAPIDYTQLVITRRLYRDGVSEYLINGNKVRLADITILLARAQFGQRAYSVVGQGMVDAFLNTTPAERKGFFDEATGVKVFQIKKHEAELKFRAAEQNLEQVETLLAEIEPRLRSLTRQVKKLEQRTGIERELQELQKRYYARIWHNYNTELSTVNARVVGLEKQQRATHKEMSELDAQLAQRETVQYKTAQRNELQAAQRELQKKRNALSQQLAEVRAQKNVQLEQAGKTDVAWLQRKANELRTALEDSRRALQSEEHTTKAAAHALEKLQKEQSELDAAIAAARREVMEAQTTKTEDAREVLQKIKKISGELFNLNDSVSRFFTDNNIGEAKKSFARLREKITELKNITTRKDVRNEGDVQKLQESLLRCEEEKSGLTQRYIETQSEYSRTHHALEQRQERVSALEGELQGVEKKLSQANTTPQATQKELAREERELAASIAGIDEKVEKNEGQLNSINDEEARLREEIITLQKKSHALQNQYNEATSALNTAEVEKARIETRLEDLEEEIRRETSALRAVMECEEYELEGGEEVARERIQKLKRQLELIGGIDPETQKEYTETKERYEFLHEQAVDLRKAITALKKVIAELEEKIQTTFNRAFKEIAKKFEEYFQILFDGGSARLEKIMEEAEEAHEDGARVFAGIDVMASPPNKKITHISMLSGGERALTSIALIAAIIAVNPSPFVMLDEVDAALDEANSQRLAKILEDLSQKTQFIAITHNRTIMYKANVIYGVTMGDDGVSKLLSVKVEDVKAARQ